MSGLTVSMGGAARRWAYVGRSLLEPAHEVYADHGYERMLRVPLGQQRIHHSMRATPRLLGKVDK